MRPQKIVNKEKYGKNEAENEEPMVTDDPVVKNSSYFDIFECGRNILNKLDAMCERACMITPRDKYYTEMFRTITDCNYRNGAPLSNEKTRDAIHRVIE